MRDRTEVRDVDASAGILLGMLRDSAVLSLADLIDQIVRTHHVYTRRQLGELRALFRAALAADGRGRQELFEMWRLYRGLEDELVFHLLKEEALVFPLIRSLESGEPTPRQEDLPGLIAALEREHQGAEDALMKMSRISGGFVAPADTSPAYAAAMRGLMELRADLCEHARQEDEELFPRALGLLRPSRFPRR